MKEVTPVPINSDDIQVLSRDDFSADDVARIMRSVPGWTDPRLQQLREEFDKAQQAEWIDFYARMDIEDGSPGDWEPLSPDEYLKDIEEDRLILGAVDLSVTSDCEIATELAARRYIIARDFNVFEDGKWQMLWKLQNGGAL